VCGRISALLGSIPFSCRLLAAATPFPALPLTPPRVTGPELDNGKIKQKTG
jgi:hypothetical protein